MDDISAAAALLSLDIVLTLILSFLCFGLGVLLKARISKGKGFGEFMKSKWEGEGSYSPTLNLMYLVMAFIISILYFIAHFTLLGGYAPMLIYLYLIPLSVIMGYSTDPDAIESIAPISLKIGPLEIKIGKSGRSSTQISSITWKKSDSTIIRTYNLARGAVGWLVFILVIVAIVLYAFIRTR